MFNRRHLRIKVLQSLYAVNYSDEIDLIEIEKTFLSDLEKSKELFIRQISLAIELVDFAARRMEDAKHKFLPTEEDLNPNTRFIDNRLLKQWIENREIQSEISYYKIDWTESRESIRRVWNKIKESEPYKEYLSSEDIYENDKQFVLALFSEFFYNDDIILDMYETIDINWHTDFYMLLYGITRFIQDYQESYNELHHLPAIVKSTVEENDDESDKRFCLKLLKTVILHNEEYRDIVRKKVTNWDLDRISVIDMLIMQMAIAELMTFPTIPIKATMNEYIEISKVFSTPKSKMFINGILDSIVIEMKNNNSLKKTGRGLMS